METLADAARRMGADWVVVSAVSEARLQAVQAEIARLVRNVPVALGGAGGTPALAERTGAELLSGGPVEEAERLAGNRR
jgi:hypothetical protein